MYKKFTFSIAFLTTTLLMQASELKIDVEMERSICSVNALLSPSAPPIESKVSLLPSPSAQLKLHHAPLIPKLSLTDEIKHLSNSLAEKIKQENDSLAAEIKRKKDEALLAKIRASRRIELRKQIYKIQTFLADHNILLAKQIEAHLPSLQKDDRAVLFCYYRHKCSNRIFDATLKYNFSNPLDEVFGDEKSKETCKLRWKPDLSDYYKYRSPLSSDEQKILAEAIELSEDIKVKAAEIVKQRLEAEAKRARHCMEAQQEKEKKCVIQ